jgi:eukaryotic-like serine/threonine-protein kinase
VGLPCPSIVSTTADPLIGQRIGGRYLVRRRLATGGMCAIYELGHRSLNRRFALKILAPELAADPYALARFGREAEVVAGLCHPNVISILDWDQLEDGSPFLVMELLDGEDLLARIARRGGLPLDELARIADEVLAGLTVAHRAGIVHRDLKPSNIFLARDGAGGERAVLLDFGISKLRGVETLSGLQESVGTPLYMAPEQARAHPAGVGPAADVWSMGAILHEMATGSPAFEADNLPAIMHRVLSGRPASLARRRPDLPDAFERLISRALDPDPTRRPRDAEALRAQLREVVDWCAELSVTDVDVPRPLLAGPATERVVMLAAPPPRRRRAGWPLALAVGFLVATASGVALLNAFI